MGTAIAESKSQRGQLTIRERLSGEEFKAAIASILPKHVTPERMTRVAMTAITRTPKLADCDQASFFRCMMDLSQWGLEPDGRRAHLIPFENRKRGVTECQVIVDYKGLVELAYRSGTVASIHADVVREGDEFAYSLGEVVEHVPHFIRRDADKPDKPGEVFAAYCHIKLRDGTTKSEVMSREEVEAIRKRSRAGQSGPWVTDWAEMAKKTAFRRASKWLTLSAEIRDAIESDDDALNVDHRPARTSGLQTVASLEALGNHLADIAPQAPAFDLSKLDDEFAACKTRDEAAGLVELWRSRAESNEESEQVEQAYQATLERMPEGKTKQRQLGD